MEINPKLRITKISKFRRTIRKNRKGLIEGGFNSATVNSWAYTNRVPSFENAQKLADFLRVPLYDIPYHRNERVV